MPAASPTFPAEPANGIPQQRKDPPRWNLPRAGMLGTARWVTNLGEIVSQSFHRHFGVQAPHQLISERVQCEDLADRLHIHGCLVVVLGEALVRRRSALGQHLEQPVGAVWVVTLRKVNLSGMPPVVGMLPPQAHGRLQRSLEPERGLCNTGGEGL